MRKLIHRLLVSGRYECDQSNRKQEERKRGQKVKDYIQQHYPHQNLKQLLAQTQRSRCKITHVRGNLITLPYELSHATKTDTVLHWPIH